MSELDKTLKAIADLCPKNIHEIENLPIPELKIGDQCLLVWSDQMDFWRVKGFCTNDGVDIVDDKFNAHMEVPRNELRLASDLLNVRQAKIDQLKTENEQLAEMNQRYIGKMQEQQDQIAELKAEKVGLLKAIDDEVMRCVESTNAPIRDDHDKGWRNAMLSVRDGFGRLRGVHE